MKQCATRFFQEDIFVRIQDDISSNECEIEFLFFLFDSFSLSLDTHIVFRVDFNNFMAKNIEKRHMQAPKLPDVTSATFFKVFAFLLNNGKVISVLRANKSNLDISICNTH